MLIRCFEYAYAAMLLCYDVYYARPECVFARRHASRYATFDAALLPPYFHALLLPAFSGLLLPLMPPRRCRYYMISRHVLRCRAMLDDTLAARALMPLLLVAP